MPSVWPPHMTMCQAASTASHKRPLARLRLVHCIYLLFVFILYLQCFTECASDIINKQIKDAIPDIKPQCRSTDAMCYQSIWDELPIWMLYPRNCTVVDPTPPDRVKTIMSPVPFAWPVRAMILFGDFHSADSRQSTPQIVRPVNSKTLWWHDTWPDRDRCDHIIKQSHEQDQ